MIAIDGPVASGKTSIGKRLADELGFLFFDTGIMYRAVTYLALKQLGSAEDSPAVTELARRVHIDVLPPTVDDGRDSTVLALAAPASSLDVSGAGPSQSGLAEDITWALRGREVEASVSLVAAMSAVREILTAQMRRVGLRGRVVMVGRDVGTVILPEADLKIFLTASVETRAQRRFEEVQARGEARAYADILDNLRERDRIDSSRAMAPLRPAEDAIVLDTTDMTVDDVIRSIEALVQQSAPPPSTGAGDRGSLDLGTATRQCG
jgi:cytidylate kinase